MSQVNVFLKDYSGRDFGGEFEATGISMRDGKFTIELEYTGKKSNKRLSVAAVSIDQSIFQQLCAKMAE